VAKTVLIVDDHPSFRMTARMLLEAEGYDVVGEAPDGASAIDCAHRLGPEVVLLDVNLPDLDGFAVAEALTGGPDGNGCAPLVVLISSRDASDFGSLVRSSGACGFIAKGELSGAALAAVLMA
jgi:DNA-binding NarL/FixJ family response regulator